MFQETLTKFITIVRTNYKLQPILEDYEKCGSIHSAMHICCFGRRCHQRRLRNPTPCETAIGEYVSGEAIDKINQSVVNYF